MRLAGGVAERFGGRIAFGARRNTIDLTSALHAARGWGLARTRRGRRVVGEGVLGRCANLRRESDGRILPVGGVHISRNSARGRTTAKVRGVVAVLGKEPSDTLHGHVGHHDLFSQLEITELGHAVPRRDRDGRLVVGQREVEDVCESVVAPDRHCHRCLINLSDDPTDSNATTGLHVLDGAHHLFLRGGGGDSVKQKKMAHTPYTKNHEKFLRYILLMVHAYVIYLHKP